MAALAAPVALVACGGASATPAPDSAVEPTAEPTPEPALEPAGGTVVIENEGATMEGHTPRGFAGSGTGLFAGDDLNPGFPDGDGVQLFVSFDVPSDVAAVDGAVLESDALTVSGTPFDDLGSLVAEPVTYDEFGPALFDLPVDGPAVECARVGNSGVRCDVTDGVANALSTGAERFQFRIRFGTAGDLDGSQDLALFFLTDSNTNEPGIFTLRLEATTS